MIASEGRVILIPLFLISIACIVVYFIFPLLVFKWINIFLFVLLTFSAYFFRDPKRENIKKDGFVSPADGKIIQIIDIDDPEVGDSKQISIFLSVFNVHSQYVPYTSKVISKEYIPGKFLVAFNEKSSLDNEQTSVIFETNDGIKYKINQIAGLIARRILNYMEIDMMAIRGERLGFIRFGSRVDIILPNSFKLNIKEGDIVIGNSTIIGLFK